MWGIYVERVAKAARGAAVDEGRIAAALPKATTCLKAMSDLMGEMPWLAGEALSLADLYAAPMFDYFLMTPEGRDMLGKFGNLAAWWSRVAARASVLDTRPG